MGLYELYNVAAVASWSLWRSIRGYGSCIKEVPKEVSLNGKVAVVTGANTGIGYETALDLARRGAKVIITCRDEIKGRDTVAKIKSVLDNADVEFLQLELGSLKSVRQFAEEYKKKNLPLHILINNAGIMNIPKHTLTEDGFESQMGVNHLGHFLLTNLLLDVIKSSAPARIINLTSVGHFGGYMRWDDFHFKNSGSYLPFQAYFNSKLANVLFTYELANRLKGTGVTVNAVHPGTVDTELARYSPLPESVRAVFSFRTPYQGALTTLWTAVAPELESVTGTFWSDCLETPSAAASHDVEAQKRLWKISSEMVNLKSE